MENKEIMEKLLDNDHTTKSDRQILSDSKSGDDLPISRIRVITAKYKVYLVVLLFFICILLLETIPNMKDKYNSRKSSYDQVKSQLVVVEGQIDEAQKQENFLHEIIDNEDVLKICLNEQNDEECSLLPDSWKQTTDEGVKYDYSIPLSYLQVNSLYDQKMSVDEKKILKNLNEYLIKEDILGNSRTKVGDLLRISIGDSVPMEGGDNRFFVVPVDVTIKFVTIDDLIGFLYNVEKKMVDNGEDRILYKIQTVSYDIISNEDPQITEISMLAYYYHDERFENIEEDIEEDIQEEIMDNSDLDEIDTESDTAQENNKSEDFFVDKIFDA